MKHWLCCILMVGCFHSLHAQDSLSKEKAMQLGGYIKNLAWVRFNKSFSEATLTDLVHHRMNLSWKASSVWSGALEIRNRFFWGADVKDIPGFQESLRSGNEWVQLSGTWFKTGNALGFSSIERLWMEMNKGDWNIRAGRQRINWGISNVWNPNDLFNTYNFLDFDYEERAGSDAIKAKYRINDLTQAELALAANERHSTMALKLAGNYQGLDWQGNIGVYDKSLTAGLGWAGSIGEAGFKGELQYFFRAGEHPASLQWVLEGDYMLSNGWYVSASTLYRQRGLSQALGDSSRILFEVSPRSLMPTRWNFLLHGAKAFTPLLTGSLNLVYAPGVNLFIFFPGLQYNLITNWDIDLVWQSFFAETNRFAALEHAAYLRLRWSF